jgi:hypothetical protein
MAKFSINSKLGEIIKDPAACAIFEKYVPGGSTNPQTKLAYGMTLKIIAGFPQAGIPKEKLAQIDAELQALGD